MTSLEKKHRFKGGSTKFGFAVNTSQRRFKLFLVSPRKQLLKGGPNSRLQKHGQTDVLSSQVILPSAPKDLKKSPGSEESISELSSGPRHLKPSLSVMHVSCRLNI